MSEHRDVVALVSLLRGHVADPAVSMLVAMLAMLWDWWTMRIEPIDHPSPDWWLAWPSRPADGLDHESGYEPAFTTGR